MMSLLPHEKQIQEYEETLTRLREQAESGLISVPEMSKLEAKLEKLKAKVYSDLSPEERLAICRHQARPRSVDYIELLCEDFFELHGDRAVGDDRALVAGLGTIQGQRFVIVGQEKGNDTESRLHRNFGMCHPEGFRKALRVMELGVKFRLPVISLVDTPGAFCGLAAEERGQGWAIARNLFEMARLPTPIIVGIIGEASSGGALAIAIGDRIGMMQHAFYSVISPEGCASILWKDASKKGQAARALKLNSENMLDFGVVDCIIREPAGGAHHDREASGLALKEYILASWEMLKGQPMDQLLERRYARFRALGRYEEESQEEEKVDAPTG